MAVFTLETYNPSETGYPLYNSGQTDNTPQLENGTVLILDEQYVWINPSVYQSISTDFEDGYPSYSIIIKYYLLISIYTYIPPKVTPFKASSWMDCIWLLEKNLKEQKNCSKLGRNLKYHSKDHCLVPRASLLFAGSQVTHQCCRSDFLLLLPSPPLKN